MQESYIALIRKCKGLRDLRVAHRHVVSNGYDRNTYLCNILVHMYGKYGSLHEARSTFDKIVDKNDFSWSIMLAAYAQNGHHENTLQLFYMLEDIPPNEFMLTSVLRSCTVLEDIEQGRAIHKLVHQGSEKVQRDVILSTAVVNMYAKCGDLEEARDAFDQMPYRNVVTWTAMIAAYAQKGHMQDAVLLLWKMDLEGIKPNSVTFISVLSAHSYSLPRARAAHSRVVASGFYEELKVQNALMDMYVKCSSLVDVVKVFRSMAVRDVISWNVMLAACAQCGESKEAVQVYRNIELEGIQPNHFTFTYVLSICDLTVGEVIQERVLQLHDEVDPDIPIINAFMSMFSRHGDITAARTLFELMQHKTIVSWTSMISAYARDGRIEEMLELIWTMCLNGVNPCTMTFTAILNFCCHSGLVYEAMEWCQLLLQDFQLTTTKEHIACVVDLFAKAGWLAEAECLLIQSSSNTDPVLWRSLLSSCCLHGDVPRSKHAAYMISQLEPRDDSHYVLMSNILKAK